MVCPDTLFSRVLLDTASQWGELSESKRYAVDCLCTSLFKKWMPNDSCTPEQEATALEKFLRSNDRCQQWQFQPSSWLEEELLTLFREEWAGFLGYNKKTGSASIADPVDLSPLRAFDYGRMGPGASAGVRHLTFYGKMFAGPMTSYDQDLYAWYKAAIQEDPRWSEAEELRFQKFGSPKVVVGNKLSFVPKNVETARTICSEASLNMFVQLGQGMILENRLNRYFGLQIKGGKDSVQHTKNQELARRGSIDGSFATIDLSSASDSISLNMLREFTPREVMWALERSRADLTRLPGGESVQLHMVSSMGNGYTFPLETALFASIVQAAARFTGTKLENPWGTSVGNWAVFGDDIIVPSNMFRSVVRLLGLLGFQVNESKTYSEGWFRESCGADWFKGNPVRGVYLTDLASLEKRFVAFNLLQEWSEKHGVHLYETLKLIVNSIPKKLRYWVPKWEGPEAGLRRTDPPRPATRLSYLQPILGNQKGKKERLSLYGWEYEVRKEVGRRVDVRLRGEDADTWSIPDLFYNPPGLLLCVQGGYIRDGFLSLSSPGRTEWRTGKRMTINWDTPNDSVLEDTLPRGLGKSRF